jgi:hypothetical protein
MQYNNAGNNVQYSAVVIKNIRWSGFICAAKVINILYIKIFLK